MEPKQKLVDEPVIDPSSIPQEDVDLAKVSFEQYLQHTTTVTQKDQGSSGQADTVKVTEPEGEVQDDSSDEADSEATVSESELDPTTLGRGKAQLKKKPTKKQKGSDEEDSTYKFGDELPKNQEIGKEQSVEVPTGPEIQSQSLPEVDVQKQIGGDDYVEITGFKAATPPPPPPKDHHESSYPKDAHFDDLFGEFPHATGVFKEDIPEEDYDMFNNEVVKELSKKVVELEKEKANAEAKRDALKKQLEELMMTSDQIRMVLIDQEEKGR
ncbi:hypothetical protein Hanom_Chr05g00419401 [Helianthus anomalus]